MVRFVFAAALVLSACTSPGLEGSGSSHQASPLEAEFTAAAREYQVPVQVLKSIAWVSTRVSPASVDGPGHAIGLMQLSAAEDLNVQVRASALTGVSIGQLKVDSRANIRGAAAVLRELFERSAATNSSLHDVEPGDWYPAVALYSGYPQLDIAASFASDVFATVERGFQVNNADGFVVLLPTAAQWKRHAPENSHRADALGDYPGSVAFSQSPNYSVGHGAYDFVVVHTMQGSYAGSRSWFLSAASNVSAHYIVRSSDGEITQMVSDSDTAWHAQCYNGRSIGIEHEGYIADPSRWYTDAMYTESAKLTAWLTTRHGIPRDRSHIIGHGEIVPSCNTNGHTDPGSGWNWTKYMSLITGGGTTPTNGTFTGAIYTGGNTANRVQGAVVTINGMSVTTGVDGLFTFSLPPGSYTANVTKSGYTMNSVVRTVAANAVIWGSMEINPTSATGTLSGKVFAFNAAMPSDMSTAITGAVVTVNSMNVTTAADGLFTFSLPPGTYTLQVTKSGYVTSTSTRTVTSAQTTVADTGLSTASSADMVPPVITFTFPQSQARLEIANVTLRGDASDDRGALASVKVSLNGAAEVDVPVTSGQFTLDARLVPGLNQIVAKGVDAAGNQASTTLVCTFAAGVSGVVSVQGDAATKIAGASVELRAVGAATPLDTVTTAADGSFGIDATTAGDYLLTVKANGYITSSQTVTVSADQRVTVNVGLVAGTDMTEAPSVSIVEPIADATIMTDTVVVYGAVKGFDAAEVIVNDVKAELIGAGGFTVTIPLVAGKNDITAVAHGTASQSATVTISVTRSEVTHKLMAEGVIGSCQSVSGGPMMLALLAGLLLRRRSTRDSASTV